MKSLLALATAAVFSLASSITAFAAPVPAASFGATGDGATDNAAAFTAMFASTSSPTVQLGPGVFLISCNHNFKAASAVSLVGAGQSTTTIRLQPGCLLAKDLFAWNGRSGVSIRNLTLDLNTPAAGAAPHNALVGYAYAGSATGFVVDHVSVINGTSPIFLISAAAAGGHTYAGVQITNDTLTLAHAATSQNQCIALTTVNGAGFLPSAQVIHNHCINSGIQVDGAATQVIGNDVSGWQFGTAIFAAFDTGVVTEANVSSHDCLFAHNIMHDAPATRDVNNTTTGGLENNCVNSRVIGNLAYNLGGAGFFNFANGVTYTGNLVHDVGKAGGSGAGGALDTAAFAVRNNNSNSAVYQAQNVTLIGNRAYNVPQAYMTAPGQHPNTTFKGNQFPGGDPATAGAAP